MVLFVNSKMLMDKLPDYTGSISFPAEVLAVLKLGRPILGLPTGAG